MLPLLDKNEKEKEQGLVCKLIPKQIIKPKDIFFLRGELFIDLNTYSDCRISYQNFFKQVSRAIFSKELGTLYTEFRHDTCSYDPYESACFVLKQNENEDFRLLADRIVKNEVKQDKEIQVKERLVQVASEYRSARLIAATKRDQFLAFRKQMIEQLPKDRYFEYTDVLFDYSSKSTKIIGNGMNELFCRLLGSDLEKMQEIFLRKGILEYIESNSRIRFLNRIIDVMNNSNNGDDRVFEEQIMFLTLDDIQIESKLIIKVYTCHSNDPFKPFFHVDYQQYLCDRLFVTSEILISDFDVKKINSIRLAQAQLSAESGDIYLPKLLPSKEDAMIIEETQNDFDTESKIEQTATKSDQSEQSTPNIQNLLLDIPYSAQSQYFVDLFYTKKPQQISKDSELLAQKTCGYKMVNQSCSNQL